MEYTKEQISELIKKAELFDFNACNDLGLYYYNKEPSNNNFQFAEKYFRIAAQKHDKNGIINLITLYKRYLEIYINRKSKNKKINLLFELGMKWCRIGYKDKIMVEAFKQQIFAIYYKETTKRKLLTPFHRSFKNYLFIVSGIGIVTLILGIIATVVHIVEGNCNLWLLMFFLISLGFLIISILVFCFLWKLFFKNKNAMYKKYCNLKQINKDIAIKQQTTNPINTFSLKVGKLGEEYFNNLITNSPNFIYKFINDRVISPCYNTQINKLEWANSKVESTSPFDFIGKCTNGKKIYLDVKTSVRSFAKINLSKWEQDFIKKINDNNDIYIIFILENFKITNPNQFTLNKYRPFFNVFDTKFKKEELKKKIMNAETNGIQF